MKSVDNLLDRAFQGAGRLVHLRGKRVDRCRHRADATLCFGEAAFFKALANFQWDRLLQTDIVSQEYLEGCYKLGQQYPDLCSSIFLMCERRDAE